MSASGRDKGGRKEKKGGGSSVDRGSHLHVDSLFSSPPCLFTLICGSVTDPACMGPFERGFSTDRDSFSGRTGGEGGGLFANVCVSVLRSIVSSPPPT
mmetsp:Transcript_49353/g.97246  ORF Transcript_49353/g.97246 Transcript_49353/m.97246 type:complete len:98 (+) Transcript_49353:135-428(+)